MLTWTAAALSDQGVKRADNQDNFYLSEDNHVFVVADGMGGAMGGSIASRLTVNAIESCWKEGEVDLSDEEAIEEWLIKAVNKANETVYGFSEENPSVKGMGTTVVVGVQDTSGCIHIGHLGDSRAYLVRGNEYQILTQDHSLVMELYRGGHITEEQMKESPFKHYITRCVGHKDRVELERSPKHLRGGDWILLCTDGLTAVLDDEQITSVLNDSQTPEEACQTLVKLTLEGGAPDNVTVIVVKYYENGEKSESVSCGNGEKSEDAKEAGVSESVRVAAEVKTEAEAEAEAKTETEVETEGKSNAEVKSEAETEASSAASETSDSAEKPASTDSKTETKADEAKSSGNKGKNKGK